MLKTLLRNRFSWLLLIICIFGSCTKELTPDFGVKERKLVINCLFDVGDRFVVSLRSSRNILDPGSENEKITGANVVIKNEEGQILETLIERNGQGIYRSSDALVASAGSEYRLEVTHPRWENTIFTGKSSVPILGEEAMLDTASIQLTSGKALRVFATIDDEPTSEDEYIFDVQTNMDGGLATLLGLSEDVMVYGDSEVPSRFYLSDQNFNGRIQTLDFIVPLQSPYNTVEQEFPKIRMVNASKDLAEYYKSLDRYKVAQSSIGSSNTSAVSIYSNIKESGVNSGIGIFAGYNSRSIVLR